MKKTILATMSLSLFFMVSIPKDVHAEKYDSAKINKCAKKAKKATGYDIMNITIQKNPTEAYMQKEGKKAAAFNEYMQKCLTGN